MSTATGSTDTISIAPTLVRLADGETLGRDDAAELLDAVMLGAVSPVQAASAFTAMRVRGETVEEITGFAQTMRRHALRVAIAPGGPVVDTCGTGGDGAGTFNVSTTAAFVAAGAGARIAKHGNRSMSSRCGSADLLEGLGARITLSPEHVAGCVDASGFGFMFAQAYHPAMRHVAPVRRELGFRTVFNLLGPLTNPAGATRQVIGVGDRAAARKMVEVLANLDCERVWIVTSSDGMDELTLAGPNTVQEFDCRSGDMREWTLDPADLRLGRATAADLAGGDIDDNVAITRAVLAGEAGPRRNTVVLNAAAALVVAGLADDLEDGIDRARRAIDDGSAERSLSAFVVASQHADTSA